MRKYSLALIVVALVFAVSATEYASAADVKMTGVIRQRGSSTDNMDQDDSATSHDSLQKIDTLWRPRWNVSAFGGKAKVTLELDARGDATSGNATGRADAEFNRFLFDTAIPGTSFRFKFGRSDWFDPSKEIFGSNGVTRRFGWGVYGKINKSLSLYAFNNQFTDGQTAASDDNDYFLQLAWKAAPNITITPWVAWEKFNAVTTGADPASDGSVALSTVTTDSTERDIWMYGLNAKAKFGIASLNTTVVIQDGKLDFGRAVNSGNANNDTNVNATKAAARSDIDIEGYAVLIRLWLNFGKLKVGFYGTFMPGDDDATDVADDLGTQFDGKLTRFVPTGGGGDNGNCSINGPQIYTRRRYTTHTTGFSRENRCGSGDGAAKGNGSAIYEILASYKLSKALRFDGNVSLIRTAAKRADQDTTGDGIADGNTYNSSKDIGTEVDISARWDIYKGLFARVTYAYLFAGDYGKLNTAAALDNDDSWALYYEFRYTF
ncbi:MAG: hypothetical protein HOC91_02145 [Nitrospinaceae bacterium]|jgi:hypothetical protein|nr:hypothetical protein [Nitrospinaceae bacterium]MBT3433800.1 hypothetical protein [Nitrospinaceae bacterium]MBT3822360.1 hypothetical protein [Nitrospinaceae bacterium]MBT4429295.1 hypothetical protein [Nitrospinaceae bacterium]MBT5368589.1 hypothetical protein [Nitrospinaceae bacterium]